MNDTTSPRDTIVLSARQDVLIYILIPAAAIVAGSGLAAFYEPGTKLESAIQHFAAGMIFAAIAGELLPQVHDRQPLTVGIGFAFGTLAMLIIKWLIEDVWQVKGGAAHESADAVGLITATGVNFVVDGFLLGLGFTVGVEEGVLLMVAVAVEIFLLASAERPHCRIRKYRAGRASQPRSGWQRCSWFPQRPA
ncbi:MAG TPA: hypothetical protein DEP84_16800 [Chloroflexi bacterium]|nr:hypothetical protein [Chloroflexota bacterium]